MAITVRLNFAKRERFLSKRFGALQEELAQLGFQVTIPVVR
jgi:hypothetical protein